MGDDVAAILLTLAAENAELREQLAAAQDMLVETAIDAGRMHASVEALQAERDAWLDATQVDDRVRRSMPVMGLDGCPGKHSGEVERRVGGQDRLAASIVLHRAR